MVIYGTFLGSWTLLGTLFPEGSKYGTKRVPSCTFFSKSVGGGGRIPQTYRLSLPQDVKFKLLPEWIIYWERYSLLLFISGILVVK